MLFEWLTRSYPTILGNVQINIYFAFQKSQYISVDKHGKQSVQKYKQPGVISLREKCVFGTKN